MLINMIPTTGQVLEYIVNHPGCKSKDIAKEFSCTSADINKKRDDYPGVYSLPGITHQDYMHFASIEALDNLPPPPQDWLLESIEPRRNLPFGAAQLQMQLQALKPAPPRSSNTIHSDIHTAILSRRQAINPAPEPEPRFNKIKAKPRARAPVPVPTPELECPICLEQLHATGCIRNSCCAATYHKSCFDGWIQSQQGNSLRCPACRAPVLPRASAFGREARAFGSTHQPRASAILHRPTRAHVRYTRFTTDDGRVRYRCACGREVYAENYNKHLRSCKAVN